MLVDLLLFVIQIGMMYSEKYGCDKVRVLTLQENRGKGGAIKRVSQVKHLNLRPDGRSVHQRSIKYLYEEI